MLFIASKPHCSRRAFLLAAGVIALVGGPALAAHGAPQILFICQFGTVKSAIARELLRKRATERGISVVAQSRGITPANHRTARLDQALAADGINPDSDPLRPLTMADVRQADVVVLFDRPAMAMSLARDWTDTPSVLADYSVARADLLRRIDRLLDEIARPKPRR